MSEERWPISHSHRQKIVAYLDETVSDKGMAPEHRLRASEQMGRLDFLNLKVRELDIKERPTHVVHTNLTIEQLKARALERIKELGISVDALPPDQQRLLEPGVQTP